MHVNSVTWSRARVMLLLVVFVTRSARGPVSVTTQTLCIIPHESNYSVGITEHNGSQRAAGIASQCTLLLVECLATVMSSPCQTPTQGEVCLRSQSLCVDGVEHC